MLRTQFDRKNIATLSLNPKDCATADFHVYDFTGVADRSGHQPFRPMPGFIVRPSGRGPAYGKERELVARALDKEHFTRMLQNAVGSCGWNNPSLGVDRAPVSLRRVEQPCGREGDGQCRR